MPYTTSANAAVTFTGNRCRKSKPLARKTRDRVGGGTSGALPSSTCPRKWTRTGMLCDILGSWAAVGRGVSGFGSSGVRDSHESSVAWTPHNMGCVAEPCAHWHQRCVLRLPPRASAQKRANPGLVAAWYCWVLKRSQASMFFLLRL